MLESSIIWWIASGIATFALYLLKRNIDEIDRTLINQEATLLLLRNEIQTIRNDYLHKNDFKEFKIELRVMFDELKSDIKGLRH
jgi:hypothetical protein